MSEKLCIKCNETKDIDKFGKFKNRDGSYGYRNVCKVCHNRQSNGKVSKNIEKSRVLNMNDGNNSIVRQVNKVSNIFTNEEIEIIKEMIDTHKNFKNTGFSISKGCRVRKTYNVDEIVAEKIKKLAYEKNITDSDMVNIIFKKFFDSSS